jgi:hypothetical protein
MKDFGDDHMKRTLLFSAALCLLSAGGALAQQAPAQQAQTQQAQPGRYVVLFPFDKATLDGPARAAIAAAAEEFRRNGSAQISVWGHTDTAGNADYNQALSERREQAVASELTRLGVPATSINGNAVGESDPAVPTGDNVREPRNRRVDIQVAAPPPPPPAPVAAAPAPTPPPPAPAPEKLRKKETAWSFSPGIFYGYNFSDQQDTHSQMIGVNLSLDYHVNDWVSLGVEQAGFYHFDTRNDGPGGRTVFGPDFHFAKMFYVGANIGYLYGSGIDDDAIAGPEAGVQWRNIDWKVAYDIPFNRDFDEGIINTTLGSTFKF